ncbi:unnamed protein product [Prorocentrum cordatum]|uniref:Uncharacterized protein n=1 Tax=Prorocentrum cordatum TaxID=2364126 RepID=A0ABN9TNG4_9DINO|nr:unnamed protein product [Polarella glacialis]
MAPGAEDAAAGGGASPDGEGSRAPSKSRLPSRYKKHQHRATAAARREARGPRGQGGRPHDAEDGEGGAGAHWSKVARLPLRPPGAEGGHTTTRHSSSCSSRRPFGDDLQGARSDEDGVPQRPSQPPSAPPQQWPPSDAKYAAARLSRQLAGHFSNRSSRRPSRDDPEVALSDHGRVLQRRSQPSAGHEAPWPSGDAEGTAARGSGQSAGHSSSSSGRARSDHDGAPQRRGSIELELGGSSGRPFVEDLGHRAPARTRAPRRRGAASRPPAPRAAARGARLRTARGTPARRGARRRGTACRSWRQRRGRQAARPPATAAVCRGSRAAGCPAGKRRAAAAAARAAARAAEAAGAAAAAAAGGRRLSQPRRRASRGLSRRRTVGGPEAAPPAGAALTAGGATGRPSPASSARTARCAGCSWARRTGEGRHAPRARPVPGEGGEEGPPEEARRADRRAARQGHRVPRAGRGRGRGRPWRHCRKPGPDVRRAAGRLDPVRGCRARDGRGRRRRGPSVGEGVGAHQRPHGVGEGGRRAGRAQRAPPRGRSPAAGFAPPRGRAGGPAGVGGDRRGRPDCAAGRAGRAQRAPPRGRSSLAGAAPPRGRAAASGGGPAGSGGGRRRWRSECPQPGDRRAGRAQGGTADGLPGGAVPGPAGGDVHGVLPLEKQGDVPLEGRGLVPGRHDPGPRHAGRQQAGVVGLCSAVAAHGDGLGLRATPRLALRPAGPRGGPVPGARRARRGPAASGPAAPLRGDVRLRGRRGGLGRGVPGALRGEWLGVRGGPGRSAVCAVGERRGGGHQVRGRGGAGDAGRARRPRAHRPAASGRARVAHAPQQAVPRERSLPRAGRPLSRVARLSRAEALRRALGLRRRRPPVEPRLRGRLPGARLGAAGRGDPVAVRPPAQRPGALRPPPLQRRAARGAGDRAACRAAAARGPPGVVPLAQPRRRALKTPLCARRRGRAALGAAAGRRGRGRLGGFAQALVRVLAAQKSDAHGICSDGARAVLEFELSPYMQSRRRVCEVGTGRKFTPGCLLGAGPEIKLVAERALPSVAPPFTSTVMSHKGFQYGPKGKGHLHNGDAWEFFQRRRSNRAHLAQVQLRTQRRRLYALERMPSFNALCLESVEPAKLSSPRPLSDPVPLTGASRSWNDPLPVENGRQAEAGGPHAGATAPCEWLRRSLLEERAAVARDLLARHAALVAGLCAPAAGGPPRLAWSVAEAAQGGATSRAHLREARAASWDPEQGGGGTPGCAHVVGGGGADHRLAGEPGGGAAASTSRHRGRALRSTAGSSEQRAHNRSERASEASGRGSMRWSDVLDTANQKTWFAKHTASSN